MNDKHLVAVRVASYAVTGAYPIAVRFTHACGDARCVRPIHVRCSAGVGYRLEPTPGA